MEKLLVLIALVAHLYDCCIRRTRAAEPAALASLVLLLAWRGITYRHFPILGLFETLTFFAACMQTLRLLFVPRPSERFIMLHDAVCILLLFPTLFAGTTASPFTPDSLDTPLFPLHVAFSFVSYAFFTLAFIHVLCRHASEEVAEMNYYGFVCFTIGMWTGGIWAFQAWGAYILFTIKEIFSFTLWLFYAALVHARFVRDRDRMIAWGTAAGFALMLFTYIGIGIFMRNTHSLG